MLRKVPLTRSENMARIRSADTEPELILRRALWRRGLRYRVNYRIQGIRVDLAFLGAKLAVFVDGCFWHGCPSHYVKPKSNSNFWSEKLQANIERDARQTQILQNSGWHVLRYWEHQLTDNLAKVVIEIEQGVKR